MPRPRKRVNFLSFPEKFHPRHVVKRLSWSGLSTLPIKRSCNLLFSNVCWTTRDSYEITASFLIITLFSAEQPFHHQPTLPKFSYALLLALIQSRPFCKLVMNEIILTSFHILKYDNFLAASAFYRKKLTPCPSSVNWRAAMRSGWKGSPLRSEWLRWSSGPRGVSDRVHAPNRNIFYFISTLKIYHVRTKLDWVLRRTGWSDEAGQAGPGSG